jgi:UDPglucose 6-dehydrogenase
VPFYEEGLESLLAEGLESGRLTISTDLAAAMNAAVLMVAVGTPPLSDGRIDLSQVYGVMKQLSEQPASPPVLVMKSTVPPGLGVDLQRRFLSHAGSKTAYIANPEFLREGRAIKDWYSPDRIVLGGDNREALEVVRGLYRDIDAPVCVMDVTSAEMVKYASNAFLATKISFINEIANLCHLLGADIAPVARAVGMDKRIGGHFLQAGLGYGGSCFPKDTRGLDFISTLHGHTFNLLKAVIEVNFRQRILAVRKLSEELDSLYGKRIGVLGLSFKPGTDDTRESPSLDILRMLLDEGALVSVYDPKADTGREKFLLSRCQRHADPLSAADGCHALVVATQWKEFQEMNWPAVRERMAPPYAVLDGRNCLDPQRLRASGLCYIGMGKK